MKKSIPFLLAALFILSTQNSPGEAFFNVRMDSTGTGFSTNGMGSGYCVLSTDFKSLTYSFTVNNLQGTITGAHFHFLPTSGVIHPITFTGNTSSGTWTNIPDTLLKYFFTHQIYVNVHTTFAGGGEIRGILNSRQSGFQVWIDSTGEGSGSSALGSGYVLIKPGVSGASLDYRFTYAGLKAARTGSHFHARPSGAVVHPITFTDSTSDGTWSNVPDSILTLLLRGQIYVNIHSSAAPGGEIRGTPMLVGVLASYAQVQGTGSTGNGTAWAVLSNDLSKIQYSVTYAGLSSSFTGAHIHTNTSGNVVHPFAFGAGNTTTGEWTGLTDVNIQDYVQNRLYVNIHSSLHPGGEISGTLMQNDGVYTATLDGTQESTSSTARGTGVVFIQNDSVKYLVTIAGLNGTYSGAHIHTYPSGSVLKPTPFTDSTASGVWLPIPDSAFGLLNTGKLYFNVHSSINPGGEIRGNIGVGSPVVTSVEQVSSNVPASFSLRQNYPNPFNPSTTIEFDLPTKSHVSIKIYSVLGQEVAVLLDEVRQAGIQKVTFDAQQLASGLYLYRLTSDNRFSKTMKMLLLK
jgi:CHRD domain.